MRRKWDCSGCLGGLTMAANLLGKPKTAREAGEMLERVSGKANIPPTLLV